MVISSISRLKSSLLNCLTNAPTTLKPARAHVSRIKRAAIIGLTLIATTATGGCSWLQFPGVYRLGIQQGNIVTQEMVDQLEPGMTKRQVNFIMGSPLIQDSFHQDRWDYFYSFRDAHGDTYKEQMTVYFVNDQLDKITGDYLPNNTNASDPIVEDAESDLGKSVSEIESLDTDSPEAEGPPLPKEIEENTTDPETIDPEPPIDG